MNERRLQQLTTLEHQYCIKCWMLGKRALVYSAAERAQLVQEHGWFAGDRIFRARRRAAAERHYREFHPEVPR